MWSAMKRQKCRNRVSVGGAENDMPAATKPFEVLLGWGGSGKSYRGFKNASVYKSVGFLGLTAALLDSVPPEIEEKLAFKMTIAAFVARPNLKIDSRMCLYIDEISMVPPIMLDEILRRTRNCAVICTGDVFQIPPILPENAVKKWFFESDEYQRRNPDVRVVEEQHRLKGSECADIRRVLEQVAFQHRPLVPKNAWKEAMNTFVEKRRMPAPPPNSTIIVFTNDQIKTLTKKWATENEVVLDRHGLCKDMPVSITANAIKDASETKVEYAYRNGQRGTIVSIGKTSTTVRLDDTGKNVVVKHTGAGNIVPQVKSAIAQTVDAAQGKTIKEHVHVVVPKTYTPHPSRLLVAFSRSKSTSVQINDMILYQKGLSEAEFDESAVLYAANFTL